MNLQLLRLMLREAAIESNEKFALKLTATLGRRHAGENIVCSPMLLQMALTLLYCGAAEETANALRNGLELQYFATPQLAAKQLFELFNCFEWIAAKRTEVDMLNAYFLTRHQTLRFRKDFQNLAEHYSVLTQRIELRHDTEILCHINKILEKQMNCSVAHLQLPTAVVDDLRLICLSALSFGLHWEHAFARKSTKWLKFHSQRKHTKKVAGICVRERLRYANLRTLQAKAVELPMEEPCLKLLVILPNEMDGLASLEEQLKHENLSKLVAQMKPRQLVLTMPLVEAEFDCELTSILCELGLINIFSRSSKLPYAFSDSSPLPHLSAIQHKVKLSLNDSSTQYASRFAFENPLRRALKLKIDHPFYFAIKSDEAVLLAGHIVNFTT